MNIRLPVNVLRKLVSDLIRSGELFHNGFALSLPAHNRDPSQDDIVLWAEVIDIIGTSNMCPPRIRELSEKLKIPQTEIKPFLDRCAHFGWLIKVTPNRYFTPCGVLALAHIAEILALQSSDGEFNPSDYRDRSGIGRNLTIQVLEFFDTAGLTKRTSKGRRMKCKVRDLNF